METQVLQDTSAGAANPHIDKTTAKGERTDDTGTNEGQAAAHDERVQRRCAKNAVERGDAVLDRDAVIKDVAVDVVDAVEGGERDAPAGAYKVEFRRARLTVVERDHDDAGDVRERGVDEQLFRRREKLTLDAVRWRAEGEESLCEQQNELLPVAHRWNGNTRSR